MLPPNYAPVAAQAFLEAWFTEFWPALRTVMARAGGDCVVPPSPCGAAGGTGAPPAELALDAAPTAEAAAAAGPVTAEAAAAAGPAVVAAAAGGAEYGGSIGLPQPVDMVRAPACVKLCVRWVVIERNFFLARALPHSATSLLSAAVHPRYRGTSCRVVHPAALTRRVLCAQLPAVLRARVLAAASSRSMVSAPDHSHDLGAGAAPPAAAASAGAAARVPVAHVHSYEVRARVAGAAFEGRVRRGCV